MKMGNLGKKIIYFSIILLIFLIFFLPIFSINIYSKVNTDDINFPKLTNRVVDEANVLKPAQISNMIKRLEEYEANTGNQMVVCFVKSIGYYSIEDYSIRLAEKWKIGYKGKDNGIIMLFAMEERKMRIEVGYGLEPYLVDSEAKLIIEKILVPNFKKGHYYEGIMKAIDIIEIETKPDASDIILQKEKEEEARLIKDKKTINAIILILVLIGLIEAILMALWLNDKISFKICVISFIFALLYISFFSFIYKLKGYGFFELLIVGFIAGFGGGVMILSIFLPSSGSSGSGSSHISSDRGSYSSSYSSSSSDSSSSSFSGGGGSFGGGGASGGW